MEVTEINKKGRPFKMEQFLPALKDVIKDKNILYRTDEELLFLVNEALPAENQITKRTFENWKAGKFAPNEELGKEFIWCIKKAMIHQKDLLLDKLENSKNGQWTRFAWLLERKFTEWNLKQISENINKNEYTKIIQINVGSEKQQELIDNLMNPKQELSEFTILEPKQIVSKNNENESYGF